MTTSHVHLSISPEILPRQRLLDHLERAASGATGHALQPAVVPVASGLRHRTAPTRDAWSRRGRAPSLADRAWEEDRMRLVAALLVLGTLLVWILFLQG